MKGLLRSVIDYGGITQDNLIANFQKLTQSRIEWPHPADKRIYHFLRSYFHQRLELPSKQTIIDHFEGKKDQESVERVSDHETTSPYSRTNFTHLLHETLEEQNRIRAITILKESQEIITKGLIVDEERKQGLRDGVLHFARNTHRLLVYEHNSRIDGNLRDDGQEVWDEYLDAKSNKGNVYGMLCGINLIDSIVRGIKKGEMWVHAAFVGELKTTFSLNWAYNLITRYRKNVLYVTLEMPYEQLRAQIYVMHSSNGRWKAKGYAPLDYDKVKSGDLTKEEEDFYQLVIKDFNEDENFGRFDVWGPDEDITIDEVQQYAELRHQEEDINLLIIDHGGLLEPRKRKRNKDYTIELNSVLRDTKKLALHFNHGEKIPILVLFQINRDGKDFADKNEGRYKLRALSYANECLAEGTLIHTDLGLVPIESVPIGCQVWSSTGWKPVLNNFSNGVRDLVAVEASNGLVIRVTPDHLFRTLDSSGLSWSKAIDLTGKHLLLDLSMITGLDDLLWPVGQTYSHLCIKYQSRGLTRIEGQLVPQKVLEDLLHKLADIQEDSSLDLLRRLLATTAPVTVRSVTPQGRGPVYDLEVTGDHEYSTGGFLTHNCERSADVVTTTYLNEEHRKEGTVLFDCLKRRDGQPFLPFKAGITWGTKRINNFETFHGSDERGISVDDLNLVLGVDAMFQV